MLREPLAICMRGGLGFDTGALRGIGKRSNRRCPSPEPIDVAIDLARNIKKPEKISLDH